MDPILKGAAADEEKGTFSRLLLAEIDQIRKEQGLTMQELSRRYQVRGSTSQMGQLLRTGTTNLATVQAVVQALGCTVEYTATITLPTGEQRTVVGTVDGRGRKGRLPPP